MSYPINRLRTDSALGEEHKKVIAFLVMETVFNGFLFFLNEARCQDSKEDSHSYDPVQTLKKAPDQKFSNISGQQFVSALIHIYKKLAKTHYDDVVCSYDTKLLAHTMVSTKC